MPEVTLLLKQYICSRFLEEKTYFSGNRFFFSTCNWRGFFWDSAPLMGEAEEN